MVCYDMVTETVPGTATKNLFFLPTNSVNFYFRVLASVSSLLDAVFGIFTGKNFTDFIKFRFVYLHYSVRITVE
jgi:hypothetical protein